MPLACIYETFSKTVMVWYYRVVGRVEGFRSITLQLKRDGRSNKERNLLVMQHLSECCSSPIRIRCSPFIADGHKVLERRNRIFLGLEAEEVA
jgi:hypothetical protein